MILTFAIVFIGLSLLILGHEAGHFFLAKKFRMKVDEFGFGFPPRIFAKKKGETEYSLNWLPFGGFVRIAGEDGAGSVTGPERNDYFFAAKAWKRALVIGAGILVNFVLGWLFISAVFAIGTPSILAVREVTANSPAAAAGVKAGDLLKDFKKADDFVSFVAGHNTDPVKFSVYRDNKEVPFEIIPQKNADGIPKIGVALEEGGAVRVGIFKALGQGFIASIKVCEMTIVAFKDLVKSLFLKGKLLEGVVGPVGIFGVAETTSRFGLIYLLQLLGIISLNLAVANLIPFPALDGGRLFLILIEKVKGSPVPKRLEAALNGIGFALLLLIMVLVTVRDVAHWIR